MTWARFSEADEQAVAMFLALSRPSWSGPGEVPELWHCTTCRQDMVLEDLGISVDLMSPGIPVCSITENCTGRGWKRVIPVLPGPMTKVSA
jgi:hypothetical protein